MNEKPPAMPRRITRGLNFRLTFGFAVVWTVLLCGIGFFFRAVIIKIQTDQLAETMNGDWAALRGHLDFQRAADGRTVAVWNFDREDPEEELTVARLRQVVMIADEQGNTMELAAGFRPLRTETPEQIRSVVAAGLTSTETRNADDGHRFLVKTGVLTEGQQHFYVALGRSVERQMDLRERFTFTYFLLVPVLLLGASWIGWMVSKRGLQPVHQLADETEAISGANLKTRVASRGAGDELDLLIENFNRMVERLEKSFNQTRQFSTDVSHELRTPLTVIRGHLEVALMTATSENQYRDAMATALADVERLSNLVHALLQLSQAESGQLALRKEGFDVAKLAKGAVEQFRPLAEANHISMSFEGSHHFMLAADRVQIERLLLNLLSNAVRYTRPGGSIRTIVRELDSSAELTVTDTGVGIPEEALPHIFERFYRVRDTPPDAHDGFGLGLSFVSWIVEAHGGTIDVESKVGSGSTFRVTIPGVVKQLENNGGNEEDGVPSERARA